MNKTNLFEMWKEVDLSYSVEKIELVDYTQQAYSEIKKFKQLIYGEIAIGFGVLIGSFFLDLSLSIWVFIILITILSLIFSFYGLRKILKIPYTHNSITFIDSIIKSIVAFSKQFLIFSSGTLIMMASLSMYLEKNLTIKEMLLYILVFGLIEIILYVYYLLIYKNRINRFKDLKKRLELIKNA